jgi:hypothetical protein
MEPNIIRQRLQAQGWQIRELPIRKNDPDPQKQVVAKWKLVAIKDQKSYEVGGATIEEAMENLGRLLGVIAWKAE